MFSPLMMIPSPLAPAEPRRPSHDFVYCLTSRRRGKEGGRRGLGGALASGRAGNGLREAGYREGMVGKGSEGNGGQEGGTC
ncbi:hypothetical protein E2C01_076875 [Portunus trituberculatus]|uniref:Uncharacterized protein n=1 Tax=Portunus trituberculatus TaxID=210409 RepID=A0A5B7IIV5_PORTR|nr:hypothetical protein [Portunus trituberculatus]